MTIDPENRDSQETGEAAAPSDPEGALPKPERSLFDLWRAAWGRVGPALAQFGRVIAGDGESPLADL